MRRTIAVLLIGLASVAAARDGGDPHDPVVRPDDRVELEVEYPPDGAVVNGSACGVFVAGHALSLSGESARLDVVIVLDTSLSTIDTSGADINGNGIVGRPLVGQVGPIFDEQSSDPGDSVLAAEIAAARLLLRGLDPRRTRLAVVTFSGEASDARAGGSAGDPPEPASTIQPLTFDHALIDLALSGVLGQEPSGSTHMAAGVDQATRELVAPAETSTNPGSQKVVVFFTDGQPTLPYGPAFERENVLAVLDAAERAAQADVRIHSFAIGSDALEGPVAVVEMAARTGGSFTPVPRAGALVELMRDVHFTSLSDVA
ncbi:MAG: VWA domain-containing protein, partial [Deltaproteobacteria bacterium]|nr:VWA domain-containing protein [Deltaproteobacteria bacterium]